MNLIRILTLGGACGMVEQDLCSFVVVGVNWAEHV